MISKSELKAGDKVTLRNNKTGVVELFGRSGKLTIWISGYVVLTGKNFNEQLQYLSCTGDHITEMDIVSVETTPVEMTWWERIKAMPVVRILPGVVPKKIFKITKNKS